MYGRTDLPTDTARCRVACPRLKKAQALGDFRYEKVKLTSKLRVQTAYDPPRCALDPGILATLDAYYKVKGTKQDAVRAQMQV